MTLPRITPHTYTRITVLALVALVVIVVSGGAVRLTGSGLGCPDWPTCADNRVVAPLEFHAMVEFVNRVFTGVVAVAVIAGALGSLLRVPRRRDLTVWSVTLVIGVVAQAILGGLSVLADLDPRFVMAHFLLSQAIVFAAVVLHHRSKQPEAKPLPALHRDYVWLARTILVLSAIVLFLGTLVTGAGPHAGDANVPRLELDLAAVTKLHGTAVWLLIAVTAVTLWRLHAVGASSTILRKGELLMVTMVAQGGLGYVQYLLDVPALLVGAHIAGATAVWIAVVVFNLAMYERWDTVGLQAFDGHPGDPDVYPR